jgi:hypothetical protein
MQTSLNSSEGHLKSTWALRVALVVPRRQAALGVGVDQDNWPISGAFGLDRQILYEHRLAAATFLRIDDYHLHVFMLP